ncbi:MAG: RrF2 family transcriptional regulator [Planctomycetota bacterium]|jgi:Rrf2 family protein
MIISRSTGYALVAVGFIAENNKDGAVLASKIAKEYEISLEYLLKILQQLVRANILKSKRGPGGGFSLARPAEHINLLQIVESVDGPLLGYLHLTELTKESPFSVKMEAVCRKAVEGVRKLYESSPISNFIES